MDVNGMISGAIPSFGSPTLEGIEFEGSNAQGVLQMKSTGRQFVQFYTKEFYNPQKANTDAPYETKLLVRIVTPGDKTEYDGVAEDYHKRAYFRNYQAFKEGKTAIVGQSVDDSEFILAPEATELRHLGVHTVEQLADASDILCEQLPRGFELREHARNWYRVNHGRSVVDTTKKLGAELNEAREVMTRQAKALEDTQKQLAEMREAMRSFNRAQMEATIETDTKKVKK